MIIETHAFLNVKNCLRKHVEYKMKKGTANKFIVLIVIAAILLGLLVYFYFNIGNSPTEGESGGQLYQIFNDLFSQLKDSFSN